MYRHSPVRNPRSKGIKIKHVLQICLLVAVGFWLIFQVKRSHDKKKEFDVSDTKISLSTHSGSEIVKFGRKDLQPKLEDKTTEVEKHEEEEEEQENKNEEEEHEENKNEEVEHEENKSEEEEQDEEKIEEEKDDGGGGDDEIDENEEKSDVDAIREEVDVEMEDEEKDGQSQTENDQDGATRNTREAREEHYKADDASSAVTHDGPAVGIENINTTLDNSSENIESFVLEHEVSSNTTGIQKTGSEENGPPSNTTLTISEETEKTSNSSNISESTEGAEEALDSYENKNWDEVEHERIDWSEPLEKEVRTDVETLPEIEPEGGNSAE